MNWMTFFKDFFCKNEANVAKILHAGACREGWLQGQLFLCDNDGLLQTNAMPQKYDLCCQSPPMICEIKICGGDYQNKMKGFIQDDVTKLRQAIHDCEKFMLLLVDNRHSHTSLGQWLNDYQIDNAEYTEVVRQQFTAKIWKLI